MSAPSKWIRPRGGGDGETEDWLITYSDAITLILAFFVMMLSLSDINPGKFEQVRSIIEAQFSHTTPTSPLKQLVGYVHTVAGREASAGTVQTYETPRGLTIDFQSSALFAPGSATLTPGAEKLLGRLSQELELIIPLGDYEVEVQGHTDDTPLKGGPFATNWDLSSARATSVVKFLIAHGLPADRLKASGLAHTRPRFANRGADGRPLPDNRALNRRVTLVIERR